MRPRDSHLLDGVAGGFYRSSRRLPELLQKRILRLRLAEQEHDARVLAKLTREFARAVTSAAQAIARVVDCPQLLMTHNGSGTLLCIVTGDSLPAWPEIEVLIQGELDGMDLRYDDNSPLSVMLSVGGPIQPNASRTQRVRKTFDRAIRRVTMRQKVKLDTAPTEKPSVSAAH